MLFGWIPISIFFFFTLKPHRAVLFSVIGGWLFLPMTGYDLPGLPIYSKSTAIAVGLLLAGRLSGQRQAASFHWRLYDLPMILWCLCPIATSMSNQLGLYDGLSSSFTQILTWGIPYLAGRIYFTNTETLRDLCLGVVIGGLLYMPLCLYEIRMSPQLSNMIYGFFPHSFEQHIRYGGFRPIVFMQHGIMVALWMATTTSVAFWLWRSKESSHINGISMSVIVAGLAITTILCKTASGWIALIIGVSSYFMLNTFSMLLPLRLLLLSIPGYIILRSTGLISAFNLEMIASHFFDADRVASFGIRLFQEDLFSIKALERPLLGWGGYGRGWPIDPETGQQMIQMIDALWLITFSTLGYLGIASLVTAILAGPWFVFRAIKRNAEIPVSNKTIPASLSIVVILFMLDSLINGMTNPIYIVISGALLSWHISNHDTQMKGNATT